MNLASGPVNRLSTLGVLLCLSAAIPGCAVPNAAPAAPASAIRSFCIVVGEPCPTNFQIVNGLPRPARSVAAGGNGVWALDDLGSVYRFDPGSQTFGAVPGTLMWLVAGGGSVVNPDEVWGGTADNQIFRWNGSWQAVSSPADDPIASVAAGTGHNLDNCHVTEVWGLSINAHLYRRNSCNGGAWELIAAPAMKAVSTGGGEVWSLDIQGQVHRFDPVSGTFTPVPGTLTQLAVGVDGVWGVLNRTPINTGASALARVGFGKPFSPQVFQFDPATQRMVQIQNAEMTAIGAGANGVWALDGSSSVWRLQAVTRKFLLQPNVALRSLSVGSGTGVWGVDRDDRIRVYVIPAVLVGAGHGQVLH